MARNAASERFAEAEVAMEDTIRAYKGAKQEWGGARRLVQQALSDAGANKAATQKIAADAANLETRFQTVLTEERVLDDKVAAEITALQASTALKYQAAEQAALPESKKRPAFIASLFSKAADEAATLAKSEALLQTFRESEAGTGETIKRLSAAIADSRSTIAALDSIETSLQSGFTQLEQAVAPALQDISLVEPPSGSQPDGGSAAAGARLFAQGAKAVDQDVSRAADTLKALAGTCKALGAVEDEAGRAAVRAADAVAKVGAWEKETKLSARAAGGATKAAADKLKALAQQVSGQSRGVGPVGCPAIRRSTRRRFIIANPPFHTPLHPTPAHSLYRPRTQPSAPAKPRPKSKPPARRAVAKTATAGRARPSETCRGASRRPSAEPRILKACFAARRSAGRRRRAGLKSSFPRLVLPALRWGRRRGCEWRELGGLGGWVVGFGGWGWGVGVWGGI